MPDHSARYEIGASKINRENRIKIAGFQVKNTTFADNPGIIYQDINLVEMVEGKGYQIVYGKFIRHVTIDEYNAGTMYGQRIAGLFNYLLVFICDNNLVAVLTKPARTRKANTTGTTRYDRDATHRPISCLPGMDSDP